MTLQHHIPSALRPHPPQSVDNHPHHAASLASQTFYLTAKELASISKQQQTADK